VERKKPGSFLCDLASLFENFIAQILKYRHNNLGQTDTLGNLHFNIDHQSMDYHLWEEQLQSQQT